MDYLQASKITARVIAESLRAATKRNPRNLPCPTCGAKNKLTPADRAAGYQCNSCADAAEGYGY